MPGFIGLPELLLLAVVVLVIFGPKRLPEMGKSLGRGLREFKQSVSGKDNEVDSDKAFDLNALVAEERETAASSNGAVPAETMITKP